MDAGKRTINDIFTGSKMLEIPFFQNIRGEQNRRSAQQCSQKFLHAYFSAEIRSILTEPI